ncbi:adenosylcobinamide-phosphate synthase CbiB [Halopenitus persicus]|uniref:Probable cobalamin biosynthesis protein CobD n=1 Tax=Halopenitus persicus TaxID=1048396 RepID=A0A1H3G7H0_9EURY|nr:adenosylcobinamide-phosphate synthase CbiB [Halopenitus persicus]SDX99201.1 adenosylcobinamide-phosphate synthase [Halopenitus persicus]
MTGAAALAVVAAAALDSTFAEPPERIHPVALLGSLVDRLDRAIPDSRPVGVVIAAVVPLGFAASAAGLVALAGRAGPRLAAAVAGLVLYTCISRRLLVETAERVRSLADSDLPAARDALRALAGRDADALSAGQVRSAAVESAAENLADGLIAPLAAFTLGAAVVLGPAAPRAPAFPLVVATGAAAWIKGVNTLDSMLGYRTRRVGWAPARLDDLAMWVPARLSALLIAIAAGRPAAMLGARRWARVPDSPNSGWPMATLAAVLDVRLEKPGTYTLQAAADLPSTTAARRGVRVVNRAAWLGIALSVGCCLVVETIAAGTGVWTVG